METKKYTIATLKPAPSMNLTRVEIAAADYADAVQQAHAAFRKSRRPTYLYGARSETYYLHAIESDGTTTDRNTPGVAEVKGEVEPEHCYSGGAFDHATRTGGCHAGEPAAVAFCDCECDGCRADV